MDINRFDKIELLALNCSVEGGYYPTGVVANRAELLMDEGIFKSSPRNRWYKKGWELTDLGKKYYDEFIKKVREKHGHVWMTYKDRGEENWFEYDADKIDLFAFEGGDIHNGPRCKNCDYGFCHHCLTEMDIPVCKCRGENLNE